MPHATTAPGRYQPGEAVNVEVQRIIASGVVVRLPDGRNGIIRHKELSWSRALDKPLSLPKAGETLRAIVLETPSAGLVQLSLRQLQGDPWDKVLRGDYQVGNMVTGQVVNLEAYGAFVEIEPGIVGLLHQSEVPEGNCKPIQELLWVGDYVEVVIKAVDLQEHRLKLSILERLHKRRQEKATAGITPPLDDLRDGVALSTESATDTDPHLPHLKRIHRILVVDDDHEVAQAFAEQLRRFGYTVETLPNAQAALACDIAAFDLVFLDLNLHECRSVDLLPQLMHTAPTLPIVLVTGELLSENDMQVFGKQSIAALLLKPLDIEEILKVLQAAENGHLTFEALDIQHTKLDFFADVFAYDSTEHKLQAKLDKIIGQLQGLTNAQTVMVFQLNTINRQVTILATTHLELESTAALPKLWLSAVKDMVVEGQPILENVATTSRRFDTLLGLLPFESCIGTSIPYATSDTRYALFVFDQAPNHFTTCDLQMTMAVSYAMAALLREDALTTRMQEQQNLVLLGQLSSSLMHEIANKLNRVQQQAALLERDSDDLLAVSVPESIQGYAERLKQRAHKIRNANTYLGDLLKQYQGLMKKEQLYEVSVNEVLLKALIEMTPFAEEYRITLSPHFAGDLPRVTVIALRLEQVFLNLMRNAVQLMGQTGRGGVLRIVTQHEPQDEHYPLKVRFEDEGPGIHRQQWDWVFEWGTSTRKGGTGLGLFVSKGLMESIRGRLAVERSCMFVGTTFVVELPMMVREAV